MAPPLDAARQTAFAGLDSLEKQAAYMFVELQARENLYNQTNPTTPQNRITVTPNYDANQVGFQAVLPLNVEAVGQTIVDGVATYL